MFLILSMMRVCKIVLVEKIKFSYCYKLTNYAGLALFGVTCVCVGRGGGGINI